MLRLVVLRSDEREKAVDLVPAFDTPSPSKDQIARHLEAHWGRLERLFGETPETLAKIYEVAGREKVRHYDGYWIFSHLLEHDIHHRSQIHQYLRILGITPPGI